VTTVLARAAVQRKAPDTGLRDKASGKRLGWMSRLCLGWLAFLAIAAAAAGVLPLSDPAATDIANRLVAPSAKFWLGTDQLGRDLLARVVYGGRISLTVAFSTALIGAAFGMLFGLLAGYFRGRTEMLLMGVADIGLAFPGIILILLVAAYAGANLLNLILAISILSIPIYMRIARAVTLTFAEREFVLAARALGASHLRILARELLPNVAIPVAVVAVIGMSRIIVLEGTLSFLGLSIPPPTPSWGNMIAAGVSELAFHPYVSFVPSAVMAITIFALNSVGNALRRATDLREAAL
jgi:ABC-type dipeptide/oligopeptide/nickel transport system permease subunit